MSKTVHVHADSRFFRAFRRANVRDGERWLSVLAGVTMLALARRRWASRGLALMTAGLLLRRGITGKCPLYRRLGLTSL
jgi:hypothetical protein